MKIYQSIPATEYLGEDQSECTFCDLKNKDCFRWMQSFGVYCADSDDTVIYKQIRG